MKKAIMDYRAFHHLSYGLYIIATAWEEKKAGYIANTVFQVTSKPPRIAISCHKDNDTLKYLLESKIFSVSVLSGDAPVALIGNFGYMSGSEVDKFSGVKTVTQSTGAPVVTDFCIAWLDCRVLETLDLGTHMLIIGQVADSGVIADGEPLTYRSYREKYKMVSPVNSPTYIEKEKLTPEEPPEKPSVTPESPEEDDDDEPYICTICGHVYRPGEGDLPADIPPGTPFRKLPEDYRCPVCNAGKDYFRPMG